MSEQAELSTFLVVIADDLTGALDAVGPFSGGQWDVVVGTGPEMIGAALATGAQVVAVSTRSRDMFPDAAKKAVATVLDSVPSGVRLFKKIDSRLKGNIALELDAFPKGPLLVVPALPGFKRYQTDGAIHGFGLEQPLAIRDVLGARGPGAVIPDVRQYTDIRDPVAQAAPDTIFVGARELAEALAQNMGVQPDSAVPRLTGDIAVAVGSYDPITLNQITELERCGIATCLAPGGMYEHQSMPDGRIVVLRAVEADTPIPSEVVAAQLARSFGRVAAGRKGLVLTGGATAEAVIDEMGIELLYVDGEALPGLPLSHSGDIQIVTKSGGFGARDTLVRLFDLGQSEA